MTLQAGVLLKSTAALEDDSVFSGTIILITEYNANGALGFVLNRPFGRSLNELEEFKHSPYFPLFEGGPVDQEHLFFVHRRPDLIKEGAPIGNGIYYGGDFSEAISAINNNSLKTTDTKIFVGYCGWHTGDLETELEDGSWELLNGNNEMVFGGLIS